MIYGSIKVKLKLRSIILSALSFFYISSAAASTIDTTFTGEVWGFNGAVGDVSVTFRYDSATPSNFSGSATISAVGDYTANYFVLDSKSNQYMHFVAPTIDGRTTRSLHLYGAFYDFSPTEFGFDRRSSATGNSYGWPDFDVVMDNSSVISSSAIDPVPIPAAVWLFASGLIGLAGVARRKKA